MTASHLITSQVQHAVSLIGPIAPNTSWQAQAGAGFEIANFTLDWHIQRAICPQGCHSCLWMERID